MQFVKVVLVRFLMVMIYSDFHFNYEYGSITQYVFHFYYQLCPSIEFEAIQIYVQSFGIFGQIEEKTSGCGLRWYYYTDVYEWKN